MKHNLFSQLRQVKLFTAATGRMILERLDTLKEETNFVYEELINISVIARDENLVQVSCCVGDKQV